ncbi:hypothetical protein N8612_05020, partial [Verrucomicrobia bacterium]|nr:hypothetical protein [Verrucomicrobiota bacterium]
FLAPQASESLGRGERPAQTLGSGPFSPEPDFQKSGGPASKRRAIRMSVEAELGKVSQACRAMRMNQTNYYKVSMQSDHSRALRDQIIDLSEDQPRYGSAESRL